MANFLTNALIFIFIEKDTRIKIKRKQAEQAKRAIENSRAEAMAQLQTNVDYVITEDRKELIRQAMKIRRAKTKIIADLKDEDKRRLYALAIKNLLNEDPDKT